MQTMLFSCNSHAVNAAALAAAFDVGATKRNGRISQKGRENKKKTNENIIITNSSSQWQCRDNNNNLKFMMEASSNNNNNNKTLLRMASTSVMAWHG